MSPSWQKESFLAIHTGAHSRRHPQWSYCPGRTCPLKQQFGSFGKEPSFQWRIKENTSPSYPHTTPKFHLLTDETWLNTDQRKFWKSTSELNLFASFPQLPTLESLSHASFATKKRLCWKVRGSCIVVVSYKIFTSQSIAGQVSGHSFWLPRTFSSRDKSNTASSSGRMVKFFMLSGEH